MRDFATLFLSGDVMTGRGIDQVLPHPGATELHEPWIRSALDYVTLAEKKNGPIPRPVDFAYPWGDAIDILDSRAPDARIINLETAITAGGAPWLGKGIHYRMHPKNLPCLTAAGIDACVLANNHVMDWGRPGLLETLANLREVDLATAGAGQNLDEARRPAVLPLPNKRRLLIFALGHSSSGIPEKWEAEENLPGVALLPDLTGSTVHETARQIHQARRPDSLVMVSIHWGGNWGYSIPHAHRAFARRLVETGVVDLIHGHSSHHPLGIEICRGKPILYGCGDLLNDYEGIRGHESYRPDLGFLYFVKFALPERVLVGLELIPIHVVRFRIHRASGSERNWLENRMARECASLGSRIEHDKDGNFQVEWSG